MQLIGSSSENSALAAYRRLQEAYANILVTSINRSSSVTCLVLIGFGFA